MITIELLIFAFVGSLTVVLDFVIYRGLVLTMPVDVVFAKAVGFLSGTIFAYFANRFWTFGQRQSSNEQLWRFILLYMITCGINVLVNTAALFILDTVSFAVPVAFILATGISATLNFVGMKFFIFNAPYTTKGLI